MTDAVGESSAFRVSIPGKTFLLGEYLALRGGPSLLISTRPCFEFEIKLQPEPRSKGMAPGVVSVNPQEARIVSGLHPHSPAARWWQRYGAGSISVSEVGVSRPAKGFGRSTAEYLAVITVARHLRAGLQDPASPVLVSRELLQTAVDEYRVSVESGRPSGADLVSQWVGGLTWWGPSVDLFESHLNWPWPDLGLGLIKLRGELATHSHLEQIEASKGLDACSTQMRQVALRAREAFSRREAHGFVREVQDFGLLLRQAGWQERRSAELCERLRLVPGVLAAKGCGAMGADVVVFLMDRKDQKREMRGRLEIEGILSGGPGQEPTGELVGDERSIASGVELKVERG